MGSILSKFRIRTQIAMMTVLALLGMVAVGVVYITSLHTQQREQVAMDRAAATAEATESAAVALLQARRSEKDFLLRRQEEDITRNATFVMAALDATKTLGLVAPTAQSAEIDGIRRGIEEYGRQFASVVERQKDVGLNEKTGLLGRLRDAVHAVEEALGAYDEPRLTVLMLQMRRDEKDFLARRDAKYLDSIGERGAAFTKALDASSIPVEAHAAIAGKMAEYLSGFAKLVAGYGVLTEETAALSRIHQALEPRLDAFTTQTRADYNTAKERSSAGRAQAQIWMITAFCVSAIMVAFVSGAVARGIYRPILAVTEATLALARGDKARSVPGIERGGETGALARALNVLRENAIAADRAAVQRAAEQDAHLKAALGLKKLVQSFEDETATSFRELQSASAVMEQSSMKLASAAEQSRAEASAATMTTGQTSANVQTVAVSAEEMARSIAEISRQVARSADVARAAEIKASAAEGSMRALAEQAGKVDDVIRLINAIARQTNLLALNATIEAARAGDAGRGFAIVAGEVKNLADQTARATQEIATQIADMQSATTVTVSAIAEITGIVAEINDIATGIATAVEEQDSVTREIVRAVQNAANGTEGILSNVQGVQASATLTDENAGLVLGVSKDLARQSNALSQEVERFLSGVQSLSA